MNSLPLVSCVIIFLNGEKFIEEAIQSVFAQTYSHWELFLVDDGSTDQSTDIAHRYAEQFPLKVRYLEHENHQNRGMSASRNLGIRHSQGAYIALLDADDIWLPDKLQHQVSVLSAQPQAAMACSLTQTWFSWTGNPEDAQRDSFFKLGVKPNQLIQPPGALLPILLEQADSPGTCGVLIHRSLIDQIGGFEESFRGMYEDQVFFTKVFLNASVYVEDICLDRYRQHANSACASAHTTGEYVSGGRPHPSREIFLNWLESYLIAQDIQDPNLWGTLKIALSPYRQPRRYALRVKLNALKLQIRQWTKQIANFWQRLTIPMFGNL
jgi:glycosyltransferase involved in cell wall biosynthesis